MSKYSMRNFDIDTETYKLRPHHLLCINFFEGKGYSEEFVTNMTEIVEKLSQNPLVEIVKVGDNVCTACPNRVGDGGCETIDKVNRYDQKVLELTGLNLGDILPWKDFHRKAKANILDCNKLKDVCGDCCWFDICGGNN